MEGWTSRRRVLIITFLLGLVSHLPFPAAVEADEIIERPLLPLDPTVMAQGGAVTASAEGYLALLSNPAGFSRGTGSTTIVSTVPWLYGTPSRMPRLLHALADPVGAGDSAVETLRRQTEESGFGFGGTLGIGYVRNGFGIGFLSTYDAFFSGEPFPSGVDGELNAQMDFIIGLSLPLEWLGVRWHLGADLRPFIRVRAPVEDAEAEALLRSFLREEGAATLEGALGAVDALNGYGIAFDAGIIGEAGDFTLGIAFRDIPGVELAYSVNGIRDVADSLSGFRISGEDGAALPDRYRIPMQVNVGVGYDPDAPDWCGWADPRFQVDVQDLFGSLRPDASFWTRVHAGAELRFFSRFALRGGISQGHPTFGAGLQFLFLDLNAAVFTRELGDRVGGHPVTGMSLEAAIRF